MRFKGQTDNQSRLTLPRRRVYLSIAFACTTAFAVAGCKNTAGVIPDRKIGGWLFIQFFYTNPRGPAQKWKVDPCSQRNNLPSDQVSSVSLHTQPASAASP